jgi:hypothetical protein
VRGKIGLTSQPPHVQQAARETFKNLIETLLFDDAFTDRGPRSKFAKDALFKAMHYLKLGSIAQRLSKDIDYANMFASLVSRRTTRRQ